MTGQADAIERMKTEHRIYADLACTLTASLDLSEILETIMRKVGELLQPRNWSLLLMEPDQKRLRFDIAVGEGTQLIRGKHLSIEEGIAGWVARTGESILITDAQSDPRFCRRFDEICGFTTRSLICVPMINREKILGVIELVNRIEDGPFSDLDMRALQTLAEFAAIAINNATLFKEVQQLSITDDHTALYNMRFLYDELDRQIAGADRKGSGLSLIFFDLDHFKDINDVHGHLCGSKMLREVGALIRETVYQGDIPVRYGGDEFVVLTLGRCKEEALEFARHLRERVNAHLFLTEEGLNLKVTASFGVASYPGDAKNKKDLLSLADAAMYRIKGSSRDGIASA
jgi:diguanylate cyclase (GGDEF)-like protein